MPSPASSAPRLASMAAVVLLAVSLLPAIAQGADEPDTPTSPSPAPSAQGSAAPPSPDPGESPGAEGSPAPLPAPATKATKLGGDWRRMARGPFGAVGVPGGWTGGELVVVDPEQRRRAAAYDPLLDDWRATARPPWKVQAFSPAYWTGRELVFVERGKAATRGLAAYDPVADRWRTTSPAPFDDLAASVLAGGVIVVASASGDSVAAYDPVTDTWAGLPPLPPQPQPPQPPIPAEEPASPGPLTDPISLHWNGERVFALTAVPAEGEAALAFVPLDLWSGTWGTASVGPLSAMAAQPQWTGETFLFLTAPTVEEEPSGGRPRDGRYDPATDSWVVHSNGCRLDTSEAIWNGTLILDLPARRGFDPVSDGCYRIPAPPRAERSRPLRAWTGGEVLEYSGNTGEDPAGRRDGIAYQPPPEGGGPEVVPSARSRPVRVRFPSLGIDLPVISTERRVRGSSRGYPACDVALYWTAFDLPGKAGTTWILAHAQQGMFLPLLEAVRSRGPGSLLGERVELQLRDGRLLTFRTYRVKSRAATTDLRIATKGRRDDEQRLVLQTSTGTGSDPKLQIAARLVGVTTTDEPRPRPRPRACG